MTTTISNVGGGHIDIGGNLDSGNLYGFGSHSDLSIDNTGLGHVDVGGDVGSFNQSFGFPHCF